MSLEGVDEVLTPDDVEREFKIKRATQASMRHRRLLPFFLAGPRMPRYWRSELLAHFKRSAR